VSDVVFGGRCSVLYSTLFIMTITKNTFHLLYNSTYPLSLDLELAIVVGILKLVENPPDLSAVRLVELVD
jgi:hypothetical protein